MLPTELCPRPLVPMCCPWDGNCPESAAVPGAGPVTASKHAHRNGTLTRVLPRLLVLPICVSPPPLTPPPTPPWFKGGNCYDVAEVTLAQGQWLLRAAVCPVCLSLQHSTASICPCRKCAPGCARTAWAAAEEDGCDLSLSESQADPKSLFL